jgi:TfoX/Sxy family transcriptional regulator of competence genes
MVASDTYAEFLREQLASLGRVTLRRMFGKTGVFCDGVMLGMVMLGMVTENTLYFRVDEENRATFREAEAFPPLSYAKRGEIIDLQAAQLLLVLRYPAAALTAIGETSSLSFNFRGSPAKPRRASAIFARPLTPVITTSTIIRDV